MTAPGGGEPFRDGPGQWQSPQQQPADPPATLNYPEYPYPTPPPYGYPAPPPYLGGPSAYPPPYDPHQQYQAFTAPTNGLAVASLITSIAGVVLGIPLAIFCYVGWLIPVVGAVLGGMALGQINRTGQQGRGLALAGVAIGTSTATLLLVLLIVLLAVVTHIPTFLS